LSLKKGLLRGFIGLEDQGAGYAICEERKGTWSMGLCTFIQGGLSDA
jgi:hypothetical protein